MNILVLGMGSNVSQGILKALRRIKDIDIHIVGACISSSSVGLYLCDEAFMAPRADDEKFIPWYIDICNKEDIDIVFTGVEENINALVQNRETVEKGCRAKFVYPEKEVWDIGFDKFSTCKWLKDHDIPYPDYALASDDLELARLVSKVGFPLIAKPRSGKSSYGIIVAHSLMDLTNVIGSDDYVIQECVGSAKNEYTIGCYFSKEGKMLSRIIMHRYLKNGGTSMAEIVNDEKIDEVIEKVGKNLNTTGPLNIQIRMRDDGTPVCFEWNVRFSGATAIRNRFGFCDVEAAIREYVLGEDAEKCFNVAKKGVAIRMDEEVYFEDTSFDELFTEHIK